MAGKIIVRKSGSQFYFALFASNSERILQSEMYNAKAGALGGAQSVKINAGIDSRYERLLSTDRKPYFVLRAANHEAVGASETYNSPAARDHGIASCKENGPDAEIVDQA